MTTPTSARASRRTATRTSAVNLVLVILILLMLNFLGFKYYAHRDYSASQFYALSPKTKDILRNLPAPLHITTLLVDNQNGAYWEESLDLLKEYLRIGGKNVTLEKVDPVSNRARAVDLQQRLHFTGNDNIFIFEYKDPKAPASDPPRSQIVKLGDLIDQNPMNGQVSGYKGEQQFTSAIVSVVEGKPAKVYFTAGHGERPIDNPNAMGGYGFVAQELAGENLTVKSLNLALAGGVPTDAAALIIAGPTVPFSPAEAQAVDQYLAANGKVMILLDPLANSGLDDVFKKYEFAFDNDIVLTRGLDVTMQPVTAPQAIIEKDGFSSHPITNRFAAANYELVLPDARSIHLYPDSSPSPRVQALLTTGTSAWGWTMRGALTDADKANVRDRTYNRAVDTPGPVAVAAVYDAGSVTDSKTKAQSNGARVVAVGGAFFLQNEAVRGQVAALDFFINSVDWLAKPNATLDISPKQPQSYGLTLSPMSERTVIWTALFFIPGAALALGLFAWFSRRK